MNVASKSDLKEYSMFKAGEGSKGGRVIGHTPSGAAVYATKSPSLESSADSLLSHTDHHPEGQAGFHYRAYLRNVKNGVPSSHLTKEGQAGNEHAKQARDDMIHHHGLQKSWEEYNMLKANSPQQAGTKDQAAGKVKQTNGNGQQPQNGEEEEQGPGTKEHHRDQALAHLTAAQAHATAAQSAQQVEEAKEHTDNVDQAQSMSAQLGQEAMAAEQPDPKAAKKSLSKGQMHIDLSAEDAILAHLDGGAVVDGQAAGMFDTGGRNRLRGVRGDHLTKGGIAGGTIYQGEHDVEGSRPGDRREMHMQQQVREQNQNDDPAGNDGCGGLPEWFADAERVNVPVGKGMTAGAVTKAEPSTVVIDDHDPMTRALHNQHPQEHNSGALMAYRGGRREDR